MAESEAWIVDGKLAVRRSATLPNVCIKCARTRGVERVERTVVALPEMEQRRLPLMTLILSLVGGTPTAGASATIALPFCPSCRLETMAVRVFGVATVIGTLFSLVTAYRAMSDTSLKSSPVVPGLVVLASFAVLFFVARVLVPRVIVHATHITLDHIVFAGVRKKAREKIVARLREPNAKEAWYERGD
jgi:hypothetical protein